MTSFCSDQIESFTLVEAGRVELPSENTSTGTSPGADGYCGSLTLPVPFPDGKPSRRQVRSASSFMVRAKLNVRTFTTRRRPIPARGPSGSDGRVKPRRELRYRRSLIYKVPVFRWSGATARYSCFNIPVETGTPPRSRRRRLSGYLPQLIREKRISPTPSPAPDNPLRRYPP